MSNDINSEEKIVDLCWYYLNDLGLKCGIHYYTVYETDKLMYIIIDARAQRTGKSLYFLRINKTGSYLQPSEIEHNIIMNIKKFGYDTYFIDTIAGLEGTFVYDETKGLNVNDNKPAIFSTKYTV